MRLALIAPILTGAPARVAIAATVAGAVTLLLTHCIRLPVRPVAQRAHLATDPTRRRVHVPSSRGLRYREQLSATVRRRRTAVVSPDDVAAWCDDMARRCRSGSTLAAAITGTSPSEPVLHEIVDDVATARQRGAPLHTTLEQIECPEGSAIRIALLTMAATARVGGPAARPLDRVAATLRLRHADVLDRTAQSAQARMSAQVLTAVPIAALVLLATLDPAVRTVVGSPVGLALVAAGSVVSAFGWWWMHRIVEGVAS